MSSVKTRLLKLVLLEKRLKELRVKEKQKEKKHGKKRGWLQRKDYMEKIMRKCRTLETKDCASAETVMF